MKKPQTTVSEKVSKRPEKIKVPPSSTESNFELDALFGFLSALP